MGTLETFDPLDPVFLASIAADDSKEIQYFSSSDDEDEDADAVVPKKRKKTQKKANGEDGTDFNDQFQFDVDDTGLVEVFKKRKTALETVMEMTKKSSRTTLDDKIAVVRKEKKPQNQEEPMEIEEKESKEEEEEEGEEIEEENSKVMTKVDRVKIKEDKAAKKKNKVDSFFEEGPIVDPESSFNEMNLSRPLMKALSAVNFISPTPVQAATVPVALLGRDICASAITGSGKTAAFMLPVLERLLYKPSRGSESCSRVLVLVPTRELAVQVFQVARQLAQFTNIDFGLAAGGLDVKAQEAVLRRNPDIIIATPGRLIDHLHNTPTFNLHSIEILILDEADRMLDDVFAEQMKEIVKMTSPKRQTMLFSATMTDKVQDLVAVSLVKPVKIFVNANTETNLQLQQEFIRIRADKEGDREAIVGALVSRTFLDRCIVFIQTKKQVHRMHIVLGLLGLRVGELHSNLSQLQRIEALKRFKENDIDVLLATDLAGRGLDIEGVKTVINFSLPNSVKHYIHRVGRTARAGKKGRSVTLVGESERKMLKEVVKLAKGPVKSRTIPFDVVSHFRDKINDMEKDVEKVLKMEKEEREMSIAELETFKAEKIVRHHDEIMSRPKRSWFQTHKERMQEKEALRVGDYSKLPSNRKKKAAMLKDLRKQTPKNAEQRAQFELQKIAAVQARLAKREGKGERIRADEKASKEARGIFDGKASKKTKKNKKKTVNSFESELTKTSKAAVKKFRYGPSFQEKKEMGLVEKGQKRKEKLKKLGRGGGGNKFKTDSAVKGLKKREGSSAGGKSKTGFKKNRK